MPKAQIWLSVNMGYLLRPRNSSRGFPFHADVDRFIAAHQRVFVVEQNRDGQLRTLIVNECAIDPARLAPILHYDGTPITAAFIRRAVADSMAPARRRQMGAVA
jgi:2-oxoglutarate ferredoxin oxidoreductase subunit alpha